MVLLPFYIRSLQHGQRLGDFGFKVCHVGFHISPQPMCLASIVVEVVLPYRMKPRLLRTTARHACVFCSYSFFTSNKNPMQNYSASDVLLLILIKSSISSCRSLLIFESPAISRSTVKTALTVMLP